MRTASGAADSAAAEARGADGSDALATLAGALAGSTTAESAPQLGTAWESGVRAWSAEAQQLSDAIDRLTDDAGSTDSAAASDLLRLGPAR
jgi:hypothetical protein